MAALFDSLKTLVASLRRRAGIDEEAELRQLRLELAGVWAAAAPDALEPMSLSDVGANYRLLLQSPLRGFERTPQEDESAGGWRETMNRHWPSPQGQAAFLAASLVMPAHQLEPPVDLASVPPWMLDAYVDYLLQSPPLFLTPAEGEAHFRFLARALDALDGHFQRPLDAHRMAVEERVVSRINVVQAYFHEQNVRPLMRSRASLIERYLIRRGLTLDHAFPAQDPPRARPRLGILLSRYTFHTESYFALSHLEGLDRGAFEIFLYAADADGNAIEQECRRHADHFVVLPSEVAEQAGRIRADDLDLLLILTNVAAVTSKMTFLACHRMARAQIASMASPVTTGLRHSDYFLTAADNEPPAFQDHYTEAAVATEGSLNHYAFQHDRMEQTTSVTREKLGLSDDQMVFLSAANFYKITPELSRLWGDVLARVRNSVLVLLPFNPNWADRYPQAAFVRRLHADLALAGVSADRVLVIEPLPTRADVTALMKVADVYLDTHPFAGACSLFDPLAVSCPPVVWEGQAARGRHGAAIARMFGLDELVTRDADGYREVAVALGNHPDRRASLRARIDQVLANGHPVLDASGFGRELGRVLSILAASDPARTRERCKTLRAEIAARASLLPALRVRSLTDKDLVGTLLAPLLPPAGHMVDVGACYGEMAHPFVARGWTADLFDPDPACQAVLQSAFAASATRVRLHAQAVSDTAQATVRFYKAATDGLSGLSPSPYGETRQVIEVPCVRLDEQLNRLKVRSVDFLKIDAEGRDLSVLASHDFRAWPPRFVLIEINTRFPEQSIERVSAALDRMVGLGYSSTVFQYEDDGSFERGVWDQYWLRDVFDGAQLRSRKAPLFANVVLHREDDVNFLDRLLGTLDRAVLLADAA